MIQDITKISSELDKAQEVIQRFIADYSAAMKKPLKRLGAVAKLKHHPHGSSLSHHEIEVIEKTLLQMETVLDHLVEELSEAKSAAFVFFNLHQLVEEVLNDIIHDQGPVCNALTIAIPNPIMLFSDQKTLSKLLRELLRPCLYMSNESGKTTLRIEANLTGGQCRILLHRVDAIAKTSTGETQYFIPSELEISPLINRLVKGLGTRAHLEVCPSENILYSIVIPENSKSVTISEE